MLSKNNDNVTEELYKVASVLANQRGPQPLNRRSNIFITFVTPEVDKCRSWASQLHLSVVKSAFKVSGYRLWVCEQWLLAAPPAAESHTIIRYSCICEEGIPSDIITLTCLRSTSNTTRRQYDLITSTFVDPPRLSGIRAELTDLGTLLVGDMDTLRAQGLIFHEVLGGNISDSLPDIRMRIALKYLNLAKVPALQKVEDVFMQKYGDFLGPGTERSLRRAVRKLLKRLQSAMYSTLWLNSESEITGYIENGTLVALNLVRKEVKSPTPPDVSPTLLIFLQNQVHTLSTALGRAGYAVPANPWVEHSKLAVAVSAALTDLRLQHNRTSWTPLMQSLERVGGSSAHSSASTSTTLGSPPKPVPVAVTAMHHQQMAHRAALKNPAKLAELEESAELLRSILTQQKADITNYKLQYEDLYGKWKTQRALLRETLTELERYKARVQDIERTTKVLDNEWHEQTDRIKLHNETYRRYEGRIKRLELHINEAHKRRAPLLTRLGLFILQLVISIVGGAIGYVVSIGYWITGRKKAAAAKNPLKTMPRGMSHHRSRSLVNDMQTGKNKY